MSKLPSINHQEILVAAPQPDDNGAHQFLKIKFKHRYTKETLELTFQATHTIRFVKQQIVQCYKGSSNTVNRIRVFYDEEELLDRKTLAEYNITDNTTLYWNGHGSEVAKTGALLLVSTCTIS